MKKLTIKSLATTGAFLLLLATSVSACGRQAHKSPSGPGAAPHKPHPVATNYSARRPALASSRK